LGEGGKAVHEEVAFTAIMTRDKVLSMRPSKPAASSPNHAADVARLKKYMERLPKALESWEEEHPHWRVEVLLWVLDRALTSLRAYIESESENEITWESPYVEIRFPVECVWDEGSTAENPNFHFQTGQVSTKDVRDDESAAETLSRLLIRHIEIAALQEWTNYSGFEKRGDKLRAISRAEDIEKLDLIADPVERKLAGEALFRGKAFGAGMIDYAGLEDGQEIDEEVAKQLVAIEPPLVFVPLNVDGHKIRVITIMEVNPPIADADKKQAYFPILVGIAIQADEGEEVTPDWLQHPWANFAAWPKEDREAIWEILHELIRASLDSLGPPPETEMVEAIVSVNAEIKVFARKGEEQTIQRAIADAVAQLQTTGEIMKLEIRQSGRLLPSEAQTEGLRTLLAAVENSVTCEEKGRSLETLVFSLFSSVSQFSVTEHARTQTEEIDLWITNNAVDGPFRREGDLILVECKNWTGKCGKNEFGPLLLKMMNRGQRCTVGFLISWNGFAETVTKEMLRGSREVLLIVPLDGNDLRKAISSGDFLATLMDGRNRALMI
jgi:hypothetical protein